MDDTGIKQELDVERSNSSGSLSDRENGATPAQPTKIPLRIRLRDYFELQLSHNHGDWILIVCSLITGLLDSGIFSGTLQCAFLRHFYI